MGSLNAVQVRQGLAQGVSDVVVDDTPVAIRMKYKGTGTVTSVVVDTDQDITLTTSDGGTEEFLLATYTTMGALVDAINGSAYWEAKLLDAKRDDKTTGSPFVNNAGVTISTDGYYDALIDTSEAVDADDNHVYTIRVTYDRGVGVEKPSGSHRVRLQEIIYNVDIGATLAKGFRIYEWDASAKTEVLRYQVAAVDATKTTINFANGKGSLDAGFGNDLIVRVLNANSITDQADNYLNVTYLRE